MGRSVERVRRSKAQNREAAKQMGRKAERPQSREAAVRTFPHCGTLPIRLAVQYAPPSTVVLRLFYGCVLRLFYGVFSLTKWPDRPAPFQSSQIAHSHFTFHIQIHIHSLITFPAHMARTDNRTFLDNAGLIVPGDRDEGDRGRREGEGVGRLDRDVEVIPGSPCQQLAAQRRPQAAEGGLKALTTRAEFSEFTKAESHISPMTKYRAACCVHHAIRRSA